MSQKERAALHLMVLNELPSELEFADGKVFK